MEKYVPFKDLQVLLCKNTFFEWNRRDVLKSTHGLFKCKPQIDLEGTLKVTNFDRYAFSEILHVAELSKLLLEITLWLDEHFFFLWEIINNVRKIKKGKEQVKSVRYAI